MSKIIERILPVDLTEAEMLINGKDLAKHIQELEEIEQEAKRVTSSYRDQIKAKEIMVKRYAEIQSSGIEERPITCEVAWHTPMSGMKSIFRTDTSSLVEELPMTQSDIAEYEKELQLELF